MLPKQARLKSRGLFTKALHPQLGHKLGASPFFQVLAVPHHPQFIEDALAQGRPLQTKYGFIVSKKVSKRAVDRNRIKRRLRQIIRISVTPFLSAQNARLQAYQAVVIIARQASLKASYQDMAARLYQVLCR